MVGGALRRLPEAGGEEARPYATLQRPSLIGTEATRHTVWFGRILVELGQELRCPEIPWRASDAWLRRDGKE